MFSESVSTNYGQIMTGIVADLKGFDALQQNGVYILGMGLEITQGLAQKYLRTECTVNGSEIFV